MAGDLRFAAALDAAMKRRELPGYRLARAAGVSRNAIYSYRRGTWLPSIEIAARIAAALHAPELSRLAAEAHRAFCAACGRPFDRITVDARFCSRRCYDDHRTKGVGLRREPSPRQRAINEMCTACEPDGICHAADCPLRPYSPMPLVLSQNRNLPFSGG